MPGARILRIVVTRLIPDISVPTPPRRARCSSTCRWSSASSPAPAGGRRHRSPRRPTHAELERDDEVHQPDHERHRAEEDHDRAVGGEDLIGWLPYLWREWITSVDHKRIGVMYVLLGLVMLIRNRLVERNRRPGQLAEHAHEPPLGFTLGGAPLSAWSAIPFDQPIPLVAAALVGVVLLGVIAWVAIAGRPCRRRPGASASGSRRRSRGSA
jgi:hypothetical protein